MFVEERQRSFVFSEFRLKSFDLVSVLVDFGVGEELMKFIDTSLALGNFGFDAGKKEYVDLVEAGIIDPTKVVRIALENAVSVASVLLLTEATMTEIPEPAKERPLEPEMAM